MISLAADKYSRHTMLGARCPQEDRLPDTPKHRPR